ncbi:MAG: redoxin domain-containing protein [Acidobacteriota bacterium]
MLTLDGLASPPHHAGDSVDAHAAHMAGASTRSPAAPPASTDLIGFRAQTVGGDVVHLGGGKRPVALVFLNDGCTISRRYVPRLNELAKRADALGVELYGVMSNPAISWRAGRAFQTEYALDLPLLFDANGEIADQLRPTIVPSAFVLGIDGRVVYRGRIDDRFPSLTKIRPEARSHELLDAMRAVVAGPVDGLVEQPAVGCVFTGWPERRTPPTYTANIAPILNANCAECHSSGGVAPFDLDSYSTAQRWAEMVAVATKERLMPPWKARRHVGQFREERFLTDRQIQMLAEWAAAGAPRGEPDDLLPTPRFERGEWQLGEPDLVLTMSEAFTVPADGQDIYRYFVLPMDLIEDAVVVAMDFKPGDASVVHHCNYFVDYSGRGRKLDAKDDAPGFSVFGTGGFMSYGGANALGAWAPGVSAYQLPEGRGFDLPRGGDIILEVHYHLSGRQTEDQSSIAFYFAKGPVQRGVSGLLAGTQNVDIPAGDDSYWRKITMDVPAAMRLVDIGPHMHYLGKEARVVATLPDGRELPLLHVTDWDLRWQGIYTYRQPLTIPADSTIEAYFRFDNSADNPSNPHAPPRRIGWGWSSDEEMAELYMTIIPESSRADAKLQRASRASWMRSADVAAAEIRAITSTRGDEP